MALKNYGYFDLGNGDIEEGQIDERQSPIAPVSQFHNRERNLNRLEAEFAKMI
jgi:hypothetical protein